MFQARPDLTGASAASRRPLQRTTYFARSVEQYVVGAPFIAGSAKHYRYARSIPRQRRHSRLHRSPFRRRQDDLRLGERLQCRSLRVSLR